MNYTATEQRLMEEMAGWEIIDCHEHLPPEQVRTDSPQDVFTLFSHYTRCDLYHLGMPSVRDALVVAKNFANVYLNICWMHIISQTQTCSGIGEMLDQTPINKVPAFGGDYARPVEKVVGRLHMAREDFARVFGARIDRGIVGLDEALEILKLWFWDTPPLYTRREV